MSGFELRAEHRPANPGRAVRLWHVVPAGRLTGLWRYLTEPVGEVRPIADVWCVDLDLRCPACWTHYSVVTSELPTWLEPGSRSSQGDGSAASVQPAAAGGGQQA